MPVHKSICQATMLDKYSGSINAAHCHTAVSIGHTHMLCGILLRPGVPKVMAINTICHKAHDSSLGRDSYHYWHTHMLSCIQLHVCSYSQSGLGMPTCYVAYQ